METDTKKKTYSEKLKDPRWQKKRLKILERDKWECTECGDNESTLHVHHTKYNGCDPWECDDSDLTTLCEDCHKEIETPEKHYEIDDKLFRSNFIAWTYGYKLKFTHTFLGYLFRRYDSENNIKSEDLLTKDVSEHIMKILNEAEIKFELT